MIDAHLHRYAPQGVAGVVLLAESHLSIHTWPEHGYAAVDVFTCGDCVPHRAVPVLVEGLCAERAEVLSLERGVAGAPRPMPSTGGPRRAKAHP